MERPSLEGYATEAGSVIDSLKEPDLIAVCRGFYKTALFFYSLPGEVAARALPSARELELY
jgi:hypothetical protein